MGHLSQKCTGVAEATSAARRNFYRRGVLGPVAPDYATQSVHSEQQSAACCIVDACAIALRWSQARQAAVERLAGCALNVIKRIVHAKQQH